MTTVHHAMETVSPLAPARTFAAATNRLLRTLPPDERASISALLRSVPLKGKQVLYKQGEPIRSVYFLSGGSCSLIKIMEDGSSAEIAMIGNEGVLGAGVFFGDDISTGDAIVHVPNDDAYMLPVEAFIQEMRRHEAFYNLIIRYSQAFTTQIMQTTVCNGLHSAEQRCCRWLLMTHDRIRQEEFALTHEFLANMLGVRRPTVTLIVAKLQSQELIDHRRGIMTIVNRSGLEQVSCECYETVKRNFSRLLPELSTQA